MTAQLLAHQPETMVTVLDGPVGSELARRGVPTPLPRWTAAAIEEAPDVLAAIHADYAAAGATVHTANTFRTGPYTLQEGAGGLVGGARPGWLELTQTAVRIARGAVPATHRVAGSIAPLADCYRPDLSPARPICDAQHGRFAEALAEAGVDLLLCETFPSPTEADSAVRAALATGLPVWLSLTVGPTGDLMSDEAVVEAAARAAELGVSAVLVNCSPPERILELLHALAGLDVVLGGYGNVGSPDEHLGWRNPESAEPGPYGAAVAAWLDAGATVVGGCCGTTPAHIEAIAALLLDR